MQSIGNILMIGAFIWIMSVVFDPAFVFGQCLGRGGDAAHCAELAVKEF